MKANVISIYKSIRCKAYKTHVIGSEERTDYKMIDLEHFCNENNVTKEDFLKCVESIIASGWIKVERPVLSVDRFRLAKMFYTELGHKVDDILNDVRNCVFFESDREDSIELLYVDTDEYGFDDLFAKLGVEDTGSYGQECFDIQYRFVRFPIASFVEVMNQIATVTSQIEKSGNDSVDGYLTNFIRIKDKYLTKEMIINDLLSDVGVVYPL